jgi:ferredoxin--NADP+ reductase|tara:strand:+ start:5715 stop:7109 length:1395 start_codon:yes stop_codon:yes gene_type:complete
VGAIGSVGNPLRVGIIGSGPAGFYTVSNFFKQKGLNVELDMFDRLPTPFGLVRAGVAPDHQKDKSVTRAYDKSASNPNFRFFGNVEYGRDLYMDDLKRHYHQAIFTTGAPVDRDLGIPGENLTGSHSATEFVAWYNGHPDFADRSFDLSQESVAIVGIGNVAMDVARILCKTHEELLQTDIADYALAALKQSKVKNVYLLGRRGPAQAAFTPQEIVEVGELLDADVTVSPEEASPDAASLLSIQANPDKNVDKNVAAIADYSTRGQTGKSRLLTFRFLVSPTEITGRDGRVEAIKLVKNEGYQADDGSVRARATGVEEEIKVGLVFRSVGYRGIALPDVPFNDSWGTIRNEKGRVQSEGGDNLPGVYTAGWIKRGPSGVIGTNKTCANETVNCMVEDLAAGSHFNPTETAPASVESLIRGRQPKAVTYEDWKKIDQAELANGEDAGRPRLKFTNIDDMLAALGR